MWPDSELAGKVLIASKNFQLEVTKCNSDKTEPTLRLLLIQFLTEKIGNNTEKRLGITQRRHPFIPRRSLFLVVALVFDCFWMDPDSPVLNWGAAESTFLAGNLYWDVERLKREKPLCRTQLFLFWAMWMIARPAKLG